MLRRAFEEGWSTPSSPSDQRSPLRGRADLPGAGRSVPVGPRGEHNLLIGLASQIGSQTWGPGDTLLAASFCEDRPVLAAVRAGFHLVLSECDEPDAVAPMATEVRDALGTLSGVNGPVNVARQFVDAWASLTGVQAQRSMSQRIYVADTTTPPDGVPGTMRAIEGAERSLLIDWVSAFHAEATPGPAIPLHRESGSRPMGTIGRR